MRIDRLLQLIWYLVNRERASARELAGRFGVSVRTIQRDIAEISAIGIPVYAQAGRYGGYAILPAYKVKNAAIRADEQRMILQALESLATSYSDATLRGLVEKYNALVDRDGGQRVFWDFGVSRENPQVQANNALLEAAIRERGPVRFAYRDAQGGLTDRRVEPLAIHYKWYAWYLFAYDLDRMDYRTFKVARISGLARQAGWFSRDHGDVRPRMDRAEQAYYSTCIPIELRFAPEAAGLVAEYFPGCPVETLADGGCRATLRVPARERLWKALLLSLGGQVQVAGPEDYRRELIQTARDFLRNCDIPLS